MKSLIKYSSLNESVLHAMKQCDCSELAGYVGEFMNDKKESFTYNKEKGNYYISSFFPTFPSPAWNRLINGLSEIVYNENRVPLQADIVVTGECHCSCWHCFRSKYGAGALSLEKIKECIDSLHRMGTATVGITGGEPMLRPDILEILQSIPDGMEGVLFTTGHGINDSFASKMKDTNLTRCILSLDHFEEKISNNLRRYPHAFDDAINAIKALANYNIYTAVTVCITHELLHEGALEKYFDFVGDLGVQEVRVVMPIPQGNLEGSAVGRFYGKAMGVVKQIKRKHESNESYPVIVNFCEFESSDYFGCGAGSNYLAINNDGNVTPCVAVPRLPYGNIYENKLEDIYKQMGKVFTKSDCVCFGIASGRVISKEKIDTSKAPLSSEVSYDVATKCRISSERAALFKYCASKEQSSKVIF